MTLPVFWMPEADTELKQAQAWYENKRSGLGERFARAVEATVETISETPMQFPLVYRELRRAGVWRFPYTIFFHIEKDRVVILACFHGRRDPGHWQKR